ncbi:hypothetical protein QR680_011228 [Steinernema hermaphroditum]|uniref:DNA-directed RNA polymerase III subunit RPC6 n=1 Tax=Steinernema hermaphroditum TaxID=289476 RepID=A0AA39ISY6_9BILA|nr:hypothetical protein QR680_011228 [Steinernema hermaphroditum]
MKAGSMGGIKLEPKEESSSSHSDSDQQLDREIITLIEQNESMSNEELMKLTEGYYTTDQRVAAVNRLLQTGKLEIINGLRGNFILRLKKQQGVRFGTAEEQAVYEAIADANSTGIWIRDIRERTGLPQAQLTRLLKSMEKQKAIKSVKTVGNTRKCYMLFDIEPDESLTGGAFFSDQQIDSQFVEMLVQVCTGMLKARRKMAEERHSGDVLVQRDVSFIRSEEIAAYIRSKGVSKVELSVTDIESVLNVAVLDGLIEKRPDGAYRAANVSRATTALACSPCIHCPLTAECRPGRVVSPETCEYFQSWLDF